MDEELRLISAIFPDVASVQGAWRGLRDYGIHAERVSFIGPRGEIAPASDNASGDLTANVHETTISAGSGLTAGAAVGSAVGILGGMLLAPIFFPAAGLVIAGPLVGALVGAGVAPAMGSVRDTLMGTGMSEFEARRIEEEVLRGGIVMAVSVPRDEAARVEAAITKLGGRLVANEQVAGAQR